MDQTFIKNLLLQGIIGITEQERSQPQDILINITLYGDTHKAGVSDNIKDCINYATIVKKTTAFVEKRLASLLKLWQAILPIFACKKKASKVSAYGLKNPPQFKLLNQLGSR
jgi:FolB domain-containing protein